LQPPQAPVCRPKCGQPGRTRHQEVAADAPAQIVHAVQELGQEGMQAGGQDLVDAAKLQVGAQLAGGAGCR
jgi:hypothetical protein